MSFAVNFLHFSPWHVEPVVSVDISLSTKDMIVLVDSLHGIWTKHRKALMKVDEDRKEVASKFTRLILSRNLKWLKLRALVDAPAAAALEKINLLKRALLSDRLSVAFNMFVEQMTFVTPVEVDLEKVWHLAFQRLYPRAPEEKTLRFYASAVLFEVLEKLRSQWQKRHNPAVEIVINAVPAHFRAALMKRCAYKEALDEQTILEVMHAPAPLEYGLAYEKIDDQRYAFSSITLTEEQISCLFLIASNFKEDPVVVELMMSYFFA